MALWAVSGATLRPMKHIASTLWLALVLGVFSGPVAAFAPGEHCAEKYVSADSIRTREDVEAFVECAHDFVVANGTEVARQAFNEEGFWKSGPIYIFVDKFESNAMDAISYVYPPDPSQEGKPWTQLTDNYGTDYFPEATRILNLADPHHDHEFAGAWTYYSWANPATGKWESKASYLNEIMWDGNRAIMGAGIYEADLSSTCFPDEVSAMIVESTRNRDRLMEFVRCAGKIVENKGFFGVPELMKEPWRSESIYVFGVDAKSGMQLFTGNPAMVNGMQMMEGIDDMDPMGQFGGRDMVRQASDFDEMWLHYNAFNPAMGQNDRKVAFVKKVMAQGLPVLVGAGYYLPAGMADDQ